VDPPQLYNLEEDPQELQNLAQKGGHEDFQILNSFLDEVKIRWDVDKLRKEVLDCQARRRYVCSALRKGEVTTWDHQPIWRASEEYIRNFSDQGMLLNAEEMARWPAAHAGTPPVHPSHGSTPHVKTGQSSK
jgi:choline-sulfatase